MFTAGGTKKAAAPKVDLLGSYGLDCKKWLGPNTAGSSVPDYLTSEYPGDYVWTALALQQTPRPSSTSATLRCCTIVGLCWVLFGP